MWLADRFELLLLLLSHDHSIGRLVAWSLGRLSWPTFNLNRKLWMLTAICLCSCWVTCQTSRVRGKLPPCLASSRFATIYAAIKVNLLCCSRCCCCSCCCCCSYDLFWWQIFHGVVFSWPVPLSPFHRCLSGIISSGQKATKTPRVESGSSFQGLVCALLSTSCNR